MDDLINKLKQASVSHMTYAHAAYVGNQAEGEKLEAEVNAILEAVDILSKLNAGVRLLKEFDELTKSIK